MLNTNCIKNKFEHIWSEVANGDTSNCDLAEHMRSQNTYQLGLGNNLSQRDKVSQRNLKHLPDHGSFGN